MAVTITPLGFKKPDGNELVRGGDNVIADNAQKAQDLIAAGQAAASALGGRVTIAEISATTANDRVTSVESVNTAQDIRIASVESAAFVGGGLLMEDPTDPGFFLVGAP